VTEILLTNDDGIDAEGLRTLELVLKDLAHLVVVAPDQERSAVGHGLTLRSRLELVEVRENHFVLNGTPADCVIYALKRLFSQPPTLVISGINHGANLGDDIIYSGTVAAAREAAHHGIPSIAISQAYDEKPISFKAGADFVRDMIAGVLRHGLGGEICLNVNLPVRTIKGIKITRQGCAEFLPHFNALDFRPDYSAIPVSPVHGRKTDFMPDYQAVMENYISVTPLQRDQTDYASARSLVREAVRLFGLK
jgi:5'-nucleotidase